MQRVWILSNTIHEKDLPFAPNINSVLISNLEELESKIEQDERIILLAELSDLQKAQKKFSKLILAKRLIPKLISHEELKYTIISVIQDANIQHDLEAAEAVAWTGIHAGKSNEVDMENIGRSVLDISACRDVHEVEDCLEQSLAKLGTIQEVLIKVDPPYASARVLRRYQLAIPIYYNSALLAHVYVSFDLSKVNPALIDRAGEFLLSQSDVIALAIERDRMLNQAEQTRAIWEASFDAVEDPVIILDQEGKVVRANRAYADLLKTSLAKLLGQEEKYFLNNNALGSLREWELEYKEKHFQVFLDPISDENGVGQWVLRLHENTKERSLTEKILAREQIAELGILVGSVAHEINNPIGGILALSQLLEKDFPSESTERQDLLEIIKAADRCKKIVQTMLALVRKADDEKLPFDVCSVLDTVCAIIDPEVLRNNVRLSWKSKEQILVEGNKNQLSQVLVHVLQQSLRAIEERKKVENYNAKIAIKVEETDGQMVILVKDNGASSAHEYDMANSISAAVTKMILEDHGAKIDLNARENENSQKINLVRAMNLQDISS